MVSFFTRSLPLQREKMVRSTDSTVGLRGRMPVHAARQVVAARGARVARLLLNVLTRALSHSRPHLSSTPTTKMVLRGLARRAPPCKASTLERFIMLIQGL